MSKRGKKPKARAEPKGNIALWLNDREDGKIIYPTGYTPLSKNEDVLLCADKIADMVSSMTIMLMANGENGDYRIKNELSRKLDICPCRGMNRKNFVYCIERDMILYGNSVAIPEFTSEGYLDNIRLLDGGECEIVKDTEGDSYYILYRGVKLYPDDVLHFVLNPSRENHFCGDGYKHIIRKTVQNLLQANATKNSFLQSKWQPSLIISVESDSEELIDPEQRQNILGSYRTDAEKGEPWLIPAGEIKVESIKPLTLNDLAIQDSISLDRRVLAAAIGIPPFMMGVGDFDLNSYNNFIATKIMSHAMIIQQEFTAKLLYSHDMYFKLNPKSLMQYSISEKMGYVKDMVAGGMMCRNEGRQEFDLAPVDRDGMNDFIVLENYIPVDRVGDQEKLKDKEVKGDSENGDE